MQRCSRIIGDLSSQLDEVYSSKIAETILHPGRQVDERDYQANDVEKFVSMYNKDQLWGAIPGRRGHAGFHDFQLATKIEKPDKLKARLLKYSKKLDAYTDLVQQQVN